MNIFFRVDSSYTIGNGHLIRCYNLAKQMITNGIGITFISRNLEGNINNIIEKEGIGTIELPKIESSQKKEIQQDNNYSNWLGVSQKQDASESIQVVGDLKPDWIIIDHYGLDQEWEKYLRPFVQKIMVIDDLANRKHDCDLLLDQNWFENGFDRYKKLIPKKSKLILGPKYALLRSDFRDMRVKSIIKDKESVKIFVFFGGSDPKGLTALTIDAINELNKKELKADIVIGKNNLEYEKIKRKVDLNKNIKLHNQVDYIASIMANSDFAIGSAGVNTWERICLGLPSIIISFAENHKILLKDLIKIGKFKLEFSRVSKKIGSLYSDVKISLEAMDE